MRIIIGGPELSIAGAEWYPCAKCAKPVALTLASQALMCDEGIDPYCAACALALPTRNTLVVFKRVPKT